MQKRSNTKSNGHTRRASGAPRQSDRRERKTGDLGGKGRRPTQKSTRGKRVDAEQGAQPTNPKTGDMKSSTPKPAKAAPASGNVKSDRRQQPLAHKMRWSRSDVLQATPEEVLDRFLKLQKEKEQLQQQINEMVRIRKAPLETSKDKSDVATGPVKRTQSLRSLGGAARKAPSYHAKCSTPSTRSAGSSSAPLSGTTCGAAQTVLPLAPAVAPSTAEITPSPSNQAGGSPCPPSTATYASITATSSTAATSAAKPKPVKRLPQYAGPSLTATKSGASTKETEDPLFSPQQARIDVSRPSQPSLRAVRKTDVALVEEELYQHLRAELWDQKCDSKLMGKCKKVAERFFRDFDKTGVTRRQVTDMTIRASAAMLKPDPLITEVRNSIKNPKHLEERGKNDKFIAEGYLGHTGLPNVSLPKVSFGSLTLPSGSG